MLLLLCGGATFTEGFSFFSFKGSLVFLFIYFLGAGSPHTLGSLVHARTLPSTRGGSRLSGPLLFHQ
jgi:hypothetical protein